MNLPPQYSQMRSQQEPGLSNWQRLQNQHLAGSSAAARVSDGGFQEAATAQRMQEAMVRTAADQGNRMMTAARYLEEEAAQAPQPLMDPAQRLLAGFKHERVYPMLPSGGRAVGELGLAFRGLT